MLQGTDIRIAVPQATFGLPEVRFGFVPGGGSLARLVRQIPYAIAMKMLLTGDPISAEEALRCGLVNEIVEPGELLPRARTIAQRITANAPLAVQAAKEVALASYSQGLAEIYLLESLYADRVMRTEDAREGPRAFQEKRAPQFQGK